MNVALTLETLPSEVMILIMQSIPSPIDLQSAINASPVMFQHYLAHRSTIMAPAIHGLKASYSPMGSANHMTLVTRTLPYRLLGKPVVRQEARDLWRFGLFPSDLPCYTNWGNHLPLICELYRQREEADHLIIEYSKEAWKRLILWKAEVEPLRPPASKWHPDLDRPLVLSEQETYAFERGFFLYESWRLVSYVDDYDEVIDIGELTDYYVRPWYYFGTGIRGFLDSSYFYSTLAFVFDKFRTLVQRVSHQLQKDPSKPLTLLSPGDNPTSVFLRRTEDREVRYIVSLCTHGYTVLQNLQQMKEEEMQNYVLSSYYELAKSKARFLASPEGPLKRYVFEEISFRLRHIFGDIGGLSNPLSHGCYFWDYSRVYLASDRSVTA
ncbi:uncharacterized protein FFUJ_12421 [Fusarium fujikuroi IMI 58289]|uniref:Uncharacterized protein n=1 Tax=Gibberella fujikuroi (strain CBS 195.34 / IMI 58289 / NRRL A-6831) TaxID=1279085 RepID=S0EJK3_GIBF5|nr:uncharacterized protein FFUJ_12421 [Fusarium fujikuroi IMI 58289]CCT72543.1 uncharacterized protein FFUJ_12421 [Fusarium fujikuroi IMI 58289]SCO23053.1 uncharacterized protein FFM5_13206 [Fusarium fujikuroi]